MILTITLLCDYYDLPVLFFFFPLKEILGYSRLISIYSGPEFPAQQLGMYRTSTTGQLVKSEHIGSFINRSRLRKRVWSTDFLRIYAELPKATLFVWFTSRRQSTLIKQATPLVARPTKSLAWQHWGKNSMALSFGHFSHFLSEFTQC